MPGTVAVRWAFAGLVLATAATGATRLWDILRVDGITPLDVAFLALFSILTVWNSISFWMSCAGAYAQWRKKATSTIKWPSGKDAALVASPSRTAVLMPICNEDVDRIFRGVEVILDSIAETGAGAKFDFFVLSDSTKEQNRALELGCWRALSAGGTSARCRVYYRNRAENIGRKSGNIAEFCENWGALYEYMTILDADSIMTGETLVALVRLMDHNPRTALIQVPPLLIGRESLFARVLQFSASVYGPLAAAGFALLHDCDGNYWGHNAIIRVKPFMRHCGLPKLPGRSPLGGEILSHDFVEAALLRRANWDLHLVPQLGGSFEEPPPTLMDFLKRDRRWCQGNLQHVRLIFAQGFRLSNRMHFLSGAMSYLSSPLWVLMLAASAGASLLKQKVATVTYIGKYPVLAWPISHAFEFGVLIFTMVALLFGPKVLALLMLLRDDEASCAHGGRTKLVLSVVLESILSTVLAPIAMISHCWFVLSILWGRTAGWRNQKRSEYRPSVAGVALAFAPHTFIAIVVAVLLREIVPDAFGWLVPVFAGAIFAIPLAYATSSRTVGLWMRRMGLFLVPSETVGVPILTRLKALKEPPRGI